MATFILTFTIVFVLLPAFGLFIGYSKGRRRANTHALPDLCHKSGGATCGCCSSPLPGIRPQSPRSCGDRPEMPS